MTAAGAARLPLRPPTAGRGWANWLNLSTPLGLLLAGAAGARPRWTPEGMIMATGYRWRFPVAGAFTVGDVVLTRSRRIGPEPWSPLSAAVWAHERRHAEQYAACLGLPFLPLYAVAAGWSWLATGDPFARNVFEVRAGLAAGGYAPAEVRPRWQRAARVVSSSRRRRRG